MKRFIFFLLAAFLSVNALFSQSLGSEANPLTIDNITEFKAFRDAINSNGTYKGVSMVNGANKGGYGRYFILTVDIDLGGVQNSDGTWSGSTWTPIGTNATYPFRGNFNAKGHKITNLYINNPGSDYQGLFGYSYGGAVIDSLHIANGYILGNNYVGGICGGIPTASSQRSYIQYCLNAAKIEGHGSYVGGISGYMNTYSSVLYSINIADVLSQGSYVGGIAGYTNATICTGCMNMGVIKGNSHVGGLIGNGYGATTIRNSINTGMVIGTGMRIGGLIGHLEISTGLVALSINAGKVNGETYVGSITGRAVGTVSECYYDKQQSFAGGIASADGTGAKGKLTSEIVGSNLFVDGDTWFLRDNLYPIPKGIENYEATIVAATPAFLENEENVNAISTPFYVGVGNDVIWSNAGNKVNIGTDGTVALLKVGNDTLYAKLDGKIYKSIVINVDTLPLLGTDDNPLLINTEADLRAFCNAMNTNGKYKNVDVSNGAQGLTFVLTDNITLTADWTPVISFSGKLDGRGNTISNLNTNGGGLFKMLDGAEITDIHIKSGSITGTDGVGSIAGTAKNTKIENCSNLALISGTGKVGGIVGIAQNSQFKAVANAGMVKATTSAGGLCGETTSSTITNCMSTGVIKVTGNIAGGIIGTSDNVTTIKYSVNAGIIEASTNVGGISGNGATLTDCLNYGTVKGTTGSGNNGTYFDSQMCDVSAANGKITTELLGIKLKGILSTENYSFTDGLYPIPIGLETSTLALAGATPVLLPTSIMKVNSITAPFSVSILNDVQWTLSSSPIVEIGSDGISSLLKAGTDTIYVGGDGQRYKAVLITVKDGFAPLGAEGNPVFIINKTELLNFQNAVNTQGTYKTISGTNGFSGINISLKAADIDLSSENWEPIGTSTHPFKGKFNGNQNEINHLKINRSSENQGFFGVVEGATIQNLHIGSGKIEGTDNVGAIAARVIGGSEIRYCTNSADIKGSSKVGGIVGTIENGSVQNCINTGYIYGSGNVGGIAGQNAGTVQYCLNSGYIEGSTMPTQKFGSIVGYQQSGTLKYCIGTAMHRYVSGIIGGLPTHLDTNKCFIDKQMMAGSMDISINGKLTTEILSDGLKSILGEEQFVYTTNLYPCPKGLENTNAAKVAISPVFLNATNSTTFDNSQTIQHVFSVSVQNDVKWTSNGTAVDPGADGTVSLKTKDSDTLYASINGKVYRKLPITVTTAAFPPLGSKENKLLINNIEEFKAFASAVNAANGEYKGVLLPDGANAMYFKLTADIELSGLWRAVGTQTYPFKGNFDGNHHLLSNIYVNETTANQGLFGYIDGATIENVHITNGSIVGLNSVGGIFGFAQNSKIQNCTNGASVAGTGTSVGNIGGIGGNAINDTIEYVLNNATVTGVNYNTAGLIGRLEGELSLLRYSVNSGGIQGVEYVGGLVGFMTNGANVKESYNVGAVNLTGNTAGAICGFETSSNVSKCLWDKQMCPRPNWYGTSSNNDGTNQSKLTNELLSNNSITDAINWELTTGLYPRPKKIAEINTTILAVTPVLLTSTETVDAVNSPMTVSTANDVTWSNTVVADNFTFDGTNGSIDCGKAINTVELTATRKNTNKTVQLRITKANTDTVFYTDTVCQRITPNTYNAYGFSENVRNLPVGMNLLSRIVSGSNAVGCDSIYALRLLVLPIDTVYYAASLCEHSTYTKGGYSIDVSTLNMGDNILYEKLENTNKLTQDKVTAFHITIVTDSLIEKCDNEFPYTFRYTYTGTTPTATAVSRTANITSAAAVNPINYTTRTVNITNTGVGYYDETFGRVVTAYDSIVTLMHTIHPTFHYIKYDTICKGDTYTWEQEGIANRALTTAGIYYNNFNTIHGCDSIYELRLTVNPVYRVVDYKDVKRKDMPFTYRDNYQNPLNSAIAFGKDTTKAGIHLIPWRTALGCDSIIELHLNIAENAYDTITIAACDNYTWFGKTYYESTMVTETKQSAMLNGCDSIFTLHLTILKPETKIEEIEACEVYTWRDGVTYTASTRVPTWTVPGVGVNTCDSIYTLHLTIFNKMQSEESAKITEGKIYKWIGHESKYPSGLDKMGVYFDTLSTVLHGCDSICRLTLFVIPVTQSTYVQETHCATDLPLTYGDTVFDVNTITGIYGPIKKEINGDMYNVTLSLTITQLPSISTVDVPAAIVANHALKLQTPTIESYGSSITQGWEISNDNFVTTEPYVGGQTLDLSYNGWNLRYWVTNECGTTYSNVVTITVTNYQLTIDRPEVKDIKVYDGTKTAEILDLKSETLAGLQGSDHVDIRAEANYDTPLVGTNKTITVKYYISGTNVEKYAAPADYIITGARIDDKFDMNPENGGGFDADAGGYCQGETAAVQYKFTSGVPTQYRIIYGEQALLNGFVNTGYIPLSEATSTGVIELNIPANAQNGVYDAQVQFKNDVDMESNVYNFSFRVNLSNKYIVRMWDDVVVCDNSEQKFTTYQWYKNGVKLTGATEQYYYDPNGLNGEYYVEVETQDSQKLLSCGVFFTSLSTKADKAGINIHPNPIFAQETFTMEVVGLTENELSNAILYIYSTMGELVYRTDNMSAVNQIQLPQGEFIATVVLDGKRRMTTKIIVKK